MNANRDRGIRAENEACRLLTGLLDTTVVRRKNEGITEDIGDLYGVADVCFQVTAIAYGNTGAIAQRAREKTVDVVTQQTRRNIRHGVVLMRLDGQSNRPAAWRAIINEHELARLHADTDTVEPVGTHSQGVIIRDLADIWNGWMYAPSTLDLYATTLEGWAASYKRATRWGDA